MAKYQVSDLIREAMAARERAYAPYSGFRVGAALLADGKIYRGCNIENASYGASNCAERTAAFAAVSAGAGHFQAIAIIGGREERAESYAWPCGICRQVLGEFAEEEMQVIAAKSESDYRICSFKSLLPHGFSRETLFESTK